MPGRRRGQARAAAAEVLTLLLDQPFVPAHECRDSDASDGGVLGEIDALCLALDGALASEGSALWPLAHALRQRLADRGDGD